jgi:hypothetical protein
MEGAKELHAHADCRLAARLCTSQWKSSMQSMKSAMRGTMQSMQIAKRQKQITTAGPKQTKTIHIAQDKLICYLQRFLPYKH